MGNVGGIIRLGRIMHRNSGKCRTYVCNAFVQRFPVIVKEPVVIYKEVEGRSLHAVGINSIPVTIIGEYVKYTVERAIVLPYVGGVAGEDIHVCSSRNEAAVRNIPHGNIYGRNIPAVGVLYPVGIGCYNRCIAAGYLCVGRHKGNEPDTFLSFLYRNNVWQVPRICRVDTRPRHLLGPGGNQPGGKVTARAAGGAIRCYPVNSTLADSLRAGTHVQLFACTRIYFYSYQGRNRKRCCGYSTASPECSAAAILR